MLLRGLAAWNQSNPQLGEGNTPREAWVLTRTGSAGCTTSGLCLVRGGPFPAAAESLDTPSGRLLELGFRAAPNRCARAATSRGQGKACMAEEPKVILLGGAPGTGKTTLGNLLVRELGLDHHLSTGFIRASVRPLLPEPEQRLLGMHAFDVGEALPELASDGTSRVFQGVVHQAKMLKPSIESCIRRAVREGMGLVIEGSHMIPGVLDPTELGAMIARAANDAAAYDPPVPSA